MSAKCFIPSSMTNFNAGGSVQPKDALKIANDRFSVPVASGLAYKQGGVMTKYKMKRVRARRSGSAKRWPTWAT